MNELAAETARSSEFARLAVEGLSTSPKRAEAKFFYDEEGSRLFDRICELEEYYPTRTETAILRARAPELAEWVPEGAALVELGSGSSTKTRILLDALPGLGAYVPLDISAEHMQASARALAAHYPALDIHPVAADFTRAIELPGDLRAMPKLLFFPGSTIGNFTPPEAVELLRRLRGIDNVAGFVLGVDLRKDEDVLVRAYDDAEGVTAAFNKNLLRRMNTELGADFDLDRFGHEARWNEACSRIEMHLVSTCDQSVRVAGHRIDFARGESIHTESSHKYSVDGFREMAATAGWSADETWVDDRGLFSVHVLRP
ncbi:L-histidine N(alpha)-methyltransferase [Brevirhabdus pacifica]|uniref:L-histidine N(Alpha)-methyltransferase n=1 Tax=Brevirhabdus pacifica TaxID=1267768 RepID=A0A1U7DHI3_9RHOB|nr:L-histidine N(alpha)-methyltransferase [Brevirhabdus pacifica]APX89442.1 L-histidine N(alpha)-methyltransferase [Brevirhabdus pacifica]OWU76540.1 methyltransferase [Loktanella sp. 22II-4b]PJJ85914.1 dimethylhistidine N-methyltransferase [Brevirhabdus pacifica]